MAQVAIFDNVVTTMMRKFGTQQIVRIYADGNYDPATPEVETGYSDYGVKCMFFDFLRKDDGVIADSKTSIRTGDKQVFIQPIEKTDSNLTMPKINPTRDLLMINGKPYSVVTVKEHNPSLDDNVLIELYVRE